jgi:hypothetical protein
MQMPGVTGVGIGLCGEEECIRIYLARPSPETEEAISNRVDGYRVDFEVTGPFRARAPVDPG